MEKQMPEVNTYLTEKCAKYQHCITTIKSARTEH